MRPATACAMDKGYDRRFAGADLKRKAAKWRCPTGECTPASVWIKTDRLHPLIPPIRGERMCIEWDWEPPPDPRAVERV
jgi:hypothetical protein